MKNSQHLYLFTLEVVPMTVGQTYNPLPSHLTLMSRFWSDLSPNQLAKTVEPLFRQAKPVELIFCESARLGPKKLRVHLIEHTKELKDLHAQLHALLDTANVTFAYPQFVGEGHKPHVSAREGDQFSTGYKLVANAAYLIEVEIKGGDNLRLVRSKFDLNG